MAMGKPNARMGRGASFDNAREWVGKAAVVLRRERDLRWKLPLFFLVTLAFLTLVNVAEYGLQTSVVVDGLGGGIVFWLLLMVMFVDDRMAAVFPDHGDDQRETDAPDSLRARYVRGDVDHETFKRRLDQLLGAPADDATGVPVESAERTGERFDSRRVSEDSPDESAINRGWGDDSTTVAGSHTPDPVGILQARFARGEIDEADFERRLAVIRETDDREPDESTESATELE